MEHFNTYLDLAGLDESGSFTGIASDASLNHNGFSYAPSAFVRSLAEHKARGSMPAMLMHHDMRRPVGRWLEITPSNEGLKVKGKLATETADGGEAYRLLRAGGRAARIKIKAAMAKVSTQATRLVRRRGQSLTRWSWVDSTLPFGGGVG